MSAHRIPGAGWAIMALLLIAVFAVLVAGGVFSDHRSGADKALDQLSQQVQQKP